MGNNGPGKRTVAKEYAKGDLKTIATFFTAIIGNGKVQLSAFFIACVALLSFVLYYSPFPPSGQFKVGMLAKRDILAPRSIRVVDRRATAFEKAEALKKVLPVFEYDPAVTDVLVKRVHSAFGYMRDYFEDLLSLSSEISSVSRKPGTIQKPSPEQERLTLLLQEEPKRRQTFEKILGVHLKDSEYAALKAARFSPLLENKLARLIEICRGYWIASDRRALLKKNPDGIILRNLVTHKETTVHDMGLLFSLDDIRGLLASRAGRILQGLPPQESALVLSMAQRIIQPNVTFDKAATEALNQQVLSGVHPVMKQFKKGDVIVHKGQRVTPEQVESLRAMARKTTVAWKFMDFLGILILTVFIILLPYDFSTRNIKKVRLKHRDLIFLGILLILFPLMLKFSYYFAFAVKTVFPFLSVRTLLFLFPLAAAGMFVRIALNSEIVLLFSIILSIFCTMVIDFSSSFGVIVFLMNLLGAELVSRCEKRSRVLWAGVAAGGLGGILIAAIRMTQGNFLSTATAWGVLFSVIGGFIAGIVVLGFTPLFEALFGYTTDVKLLELANLEHPLLKEMILKAPGTYHHSIIVASLAEAAARDIGAHPILVRVGAYYHDIGKIKKPLYFIENQQQGINKHDKLTPSMSSLILISHVKEGVELAKAYHLGSEIIDIIQQHHGTSLIRFFYNKAVEAAGGQTDEIDEKVFRYPGPKPQTREAGLIMLADAVEATARSLESPTPARITTIVQETINRIFIDGQLDECELSLKNLHQIADRFRMVLMAIFHHRIDYPAEIGKGGQKNEKGEKWPKYGQKTIKAA